ncbi:ABC transporter ATP-binding protein [Lacicoccus qingdaonensis]|uniref:ABC-2 type transport system ATP-binding protein n=1 Tax=Lacicoccus qingdaonensis TaxID=576118 RepID=A0A1G9I7T1_9BACL|nr:ABC transporter ATP-binding protein [Salinicoccus qingdaonensis]SDL21291.1 ABC-2 type transport system ATP-binding protein [Salinicoccus qingdaonensis]
MDILKIENLSKSFNDKNVIDNLSLIVRENEIYGFIGSNGSGKTTTMNMILGQLEPNGGDIYVCGEKVNFGNTETNKYIGYLPDVPEFYNYMTAPQYLRLCAKLTDLKKNERESRIDYLLSIVGLSGERSKIKAYSRGMKQRLGVAQALIHQPELLICDEPTSALDPKGRMELLKILKDITAETTVIFSTHVLTDVERISDYAGILYEGNIVKEIDLSKTDFGDKGIDLKLDSNEYKSLSERIELSHLQGDNYRAVDISLRDLYQLLYTLDIQPSQLELSKKSLEDIYLEVTR